MPEENKSSWLSEAAEIRQHGLLKILCKGQYVMDFFL